MSNYEIKIRGIDNNQNKSIWLNLNNVEKEKSEGSYNSLGYLEEIEGFIRKKEKSNKNMEILEKIIKEKRWFVIDVLDKVKIIEDIIKIIKEEKIYKKIVICGYENYLYKLKEMYKDIINELKIDLKMNEEIFNIKKEYNEEGDLKKTINKKKNKILEYDLIIIDELCIIEDYYNNYLIENINKKNMIIILKNNIYKCDLELKKKLKKIVYKNNIILEKYLNIKEINKKNIKEICEELNIKIVEKN